MSIASSLVRHESMQQEGRRWTWVYGTASAALLGINETILITHNACFLCHLSHIPIDSEYRIGRERPNHYTSYSSPSTFCALASRRARDSAIVCFSFHTSKGEGCERGGGEAKRGISSRIRFRNHCSYDDFSCHRVATFTSHAFLAYFLLAHLCLTSSQFQQSKVPSKSNNRCDEDSS
jgi:hypothetical protein